MKWKLKQKVITLKIHLKIIESFMDYEINMTIHDYIFHKKSLERKCLMLFREDQYKLYSTSILKPTLTFQLSSDTLFKFSSMK